MAVYYLLPFRLGKGTRYLIWFSTDDEAEASGCDGVVTTSDRRIAVFSSASAAVQFGESQLFSLTTDQALSSLDLNHLARWLRTRNQRKSQRIDCGLFLNIWNLLADISASIDGSFDLDRRRTQRVYEKLFWGNNLPTVTPEGRSYIPLWRYSELKLIRETLGQGLAMFRANAFEIPPLPADPLIH